VLPSVRDAAHMGCKEVVIFDHSGHATQAPIAILAVKDEVIGGSTKVRISTAFGSLRLVPFSLAAEGMQDCWAVG